MNRQKQEMARHLARRHGIPLDSDFHALPFALAEKLATIAVAVGYQKPRNASGSRARCFHAYLTRGV